MLISSQGPALVHMTASPATLVTAVSLPSASLIEGDIIRVHAIIQIDNGTILPTDAVWTFVIAGITLLIINSETIADADTETVEVDIIARIGSIATPTATPIRIDWNSSRYALGVNSTQVSWSGSTFNRNNAQTITVTLQTSTTDADIEVTLAIFTVEKLRLS